MYEEFFFFRFVTEERFSLFFVSFRCHHTRVYLDKKNSFVTVVECTHKFIEIVQGYKLSGESASQARQSDHIASSNFVVCCDNNKEIHKFTFDLRESGVNFISSHWRNKPKERNRISSSSIFDTVNTSKWILMRIRVKGHRHLSHQLVILNNFCSTNSAVWVPQITTSWWVNYKKCSEISWTTRQPVSSWTWTIGMCAIIAFLWPYFCKQSLLLLLSLS